MLGWRGEPLSSCQLLLSCCTFSSCPIDQYSSQAAGNASYAGGFAAVMANVVLIAYIIAAVREDQSEKIEQERLKKAQ